MARPALCHTTGRSWRDRAPLILSAYLHDSFKYLRPNQHNNTVQLGAERRSSFSFPTNSPNSTLDFCVRKTAVMTTHQSQGSRHRNEGLHTLAIRHPLTRQDRTERRPLSSQTQQDWTGWRRLLKPPPPQDVQDLFPPSPAQCI